MKRKKRRLIAWLLTLFLLLTLQPGSAYRAHAENEPSKGHTEGKAFVRRFARDGDTVLFGYYDSDGRYVNSDYNYKVTVDGNEYRLNTVCIRFDWSPGENEYEFDIKSPTEITNTKAKQMVYHAVHMLPYGIAHRVLCYWFGQVEPKAVSGQDLSGGNDSETMKTYGSKKISVSGFSGTVDEYIAKYTSKDEAIPTNVEFHAYYLDSDSTKPKSHTAYQDFLTWTEKVIEEKEYFAAVRKTDEEGIAIPDATFDVAINGDKKNLQTVKTDKDGIAVISLGYYLEKPVISVRERTDWDGASGFKVDNKWYGTKEGSGNISVYETKAEARKNATSLHHTWTNPHGDIFVALKKETARAAVTTGNPNYSLEGAEYKLYTTEKAAKDAAATGNFSAAIGTFTLRADGSSNLLKVQKYMAKDNRNRINAEGTQFYVVESKAPKNYQLSKEVTSVLVKPENDESHPATAYVHDVPVTCTLRTVLSKTSTGNRKFELEGAEFILRFYPEDISKGYTYEQLQTMKADESRTKKLVTHLTTVDGKELIGVELDEEYPLGYFTLEETEAPREYLAADQGGTASVNGMQVPARMSFSTAVTGSPEKGYSAAGFRCTEAGLQTVRLSDEDENLICYADERIRGDLEIRKTQGESEEPLEGAVFLIENLRTHETHRIVTDPDGFASTASVYQPHDENTGYYDDEKAYDGTKAGIWFREDPENPDGEDIVPVNSKGALVSGEYLITEVDAAGLQKEEPVEIRVVSNGTVYPVYDPERGDGKQELTDMPMPTLGTRAVTTDPEKGGESKLLLNGPDQTIYDICEYGHLLVDTDYTLVGTVMLKEEDGSVTPFRRQDGSVVTSKTTFHTKQGYDRSRYEACGTELVKFDGLDFTAYEGRSFVVYERLYLGTETESAAVMTQYPGSNNTEVSFPLIHEDPQDADQTVEVPWNRTPRIIRTTLLDSATGQHVADAKENVTFIDQVEYEGLIPRRADKGEKPYVIEGVLMDRATGKPLLDENKKEIRGRTEVYPGETGRGIAEVKFTFHAGLLSMDGREVVCFESLYEEQEGELLHKHADLDNRDQTVQFPKVETKAADPAVTDVSAKQQRICVTDHVYYENLPAKAADGSKLSYTVRGRLMNPDGSAALINGEEVVSEVVFTPEKEKGTVDVTFPEFDLALADGQSRAEFTYVIFEEVYLTRENPKTGGKELLQVGEHKDIKSREQTVSGHLEFRDEPKTGDDTPVALLLSVLILSLLAVAGILFLRKRN